MKVFYFLFYLIFTFLISITPLLAETQTTTIYVATNGNDSWSGKLSDPNTDKTDGPFATIERARDAIRVLKGMGTLSNPVSVQVRGGKYFLSKPITLNEKDSGTKESPVTYVAYPGETPIISGGKAITAQWRKYRGDILICSLPEVKSNNWVFHQLFINGKRKLRARTPNEGDFWVAGVTGEKERSSFKYKSDDIQRWRNLNDVEVYVYHSWDAVRLLISDIDEKNRVVTFTGPSNFWFDYWGLARYFVENALELVDVPGEWYLDQHTGELYYLPLPGENLSSAEIIAPVLNELLRVEGNLETKEYVKYVTFSGFTFTDSDWPLPEKGYTGGQAGLVNPSAVTFIGAEHCTFDKNRIVNTGMYGIAVEKGCKDNIISNSEIAYTGGGGVRIGTMDRKDLTSKRTTFFNNHIHDTGAIYNAGVGIWVGQSSENIISHNLVHDITYSGMSIGWTWSYDDNPCYGNTIEYNEVYRVMKNSNDGAGIYTLGKQMGSVIRNNIFHDIYPYHHFGWGIYLDESSSYFTVMNNIVYRTLAGGTMIHGGRFNHWENNIFVEAKDSQIFWNTRNNDSYGNRYLKNIFYYTNPESKWIYVPGRWTWYAVEEFDFNIIYCPNIKDFIVDGIKGVPTFTEWQKHGFDKNSIIADPMFVDPANDNYSLKPESPAFKLGFKPIDMSTVGLVK